MSINNEGSEREGFDPLSRLVYPASRAMKMKSLFWVLFLFLIAGCGADVLSKKDRQRVDQILAHWESWVPARQKNGTAPLLTFQELYQGLEAGQIQFLDKIRFMEKGGIFPEPGIPLKKIEGQKILKKGKLEEIGAQYLPPAVFDAYEKMMAAMKLELGKRLYVDSGYRSPAYQLYTFLFYLPKHHYSLKEGRQWVALPGHSEHGNPGRQAIDFINEEGENGDDAAELFEALPEYAWLKKNASKFGFELSYPRGTKGTVFEPWHWRHVPSKEIHD